jgi:hypothetical protein
LSGPPAPGVEGRKRLSKDKEFVSNKIPGQGLSAEADILFWGQEGHSGARCYLVGGTYSKSSSEVPREKAPAVWLGFSPFCI